MAKRPFSHGIALACLASTLWIAGCGDGGTTPTVDSGFPEDTTDTGPVDTGSTDTGSTDTGPTDTGSTDTGPADTGTPDADTDAGPTDSGIADSGPTDTGPTDSGPVDAGPTDSGPTDTGPADTGPADTGPTLGGVGATCAMTSDCLPALRCDNNRCRSDVGGTCANDGECSTGMSCQSNVCRVNRGGTCTSTTDCAMALRCESGTCRADRGGACTTTTECAPTLTCESMVCRVPRGGMCMATSDCAASLTCESNTCRGTDGASCTGNTDCADALRCVSGTCRPRGGSACANDSECGTGYACASGVCLRPLGGACTTDGECSGGAVCASSRCTALPNCTAIYRNRPTSRSGVYTIDFDGAGPQSPFAVYCAMGIDNAGWTLVYKVSDGNSGDPSTLWTAGPQREDDPSILHLERSPNVYANRLIGAWNMTFPVAEARVGVYVAGVERSFARFDALGSDRTNWFARGRLRASSWVDFPDRPNNVFALAGATTTTRRWHINAVYNSCPNDAGWLSVNATGTPSCPWDGDGSGIRIRFANGPARSNWNTTSIVRAGDAFGVFVRAPEPSAACQTELQCGAGMRCDGGQCRALEGNACRRETDCVAGVACDRGVCRPRPSGACSNDSACTAMGAVCVDGACRRLPGQACSGDDACVPGAVCNGGMCAALANCSAVYRHNPTLRSGTYMIDYDGTGPQPAVLVYCDMGPDRAGWTMVYKVSTGAAGDPNTLWNGGAVNDTDASYLTPERSAGQYVSRLLGAWNMTFPVTQVRAAVYVAGNERVYTRYDGLGSTRANWFNRDRVRASSWTDLYNTSNFWSIDGTNVRRFHINAVYNSCPNDAGWLSITAPGTAPCPWDTSGTNVAIRYSDSVGRSNWNDTNSVRTGDTFAVYVRSPEPGEACQTELQCGPGMLCEGGQCRALAGNGCTSSRDCTGTNGCVAGVCRAVGNGGCTTSSMCMSGQVCAGNQCLADVGGACTSDASCRPGALCTDGTCAALASCAAIARANPDARSGPYVIDFDGTGPTAALPVYCDLGPEGTGWTLVHKLSTGVGGDPNALWNGNALNETDETLLHTGRSSAVYLSRIATGWNMTAPIWESRITTVTSGVERVALRFDAAGSTRTNWLVRDRLLSSPWSDLAADTAINYFGIEGAALNRRWHINHVYGGCPADTGWLSAAGVGTGFCAWDGDGTVVRIFTSDAPYRTNWNEPRYARPQDALLVWARAPSPGVACQTELQCGAGMRCEANLCRALASQPCDTTRDCAVGLSCSARRCR